MSAEQTPNTQGRVIGALRRLVGNILPQKEINREPLDDLQGIKSLVTEVRRKRMLDSIETQMQIIGQAVGQGRMIGLEPMMTATDEKVFRKNWRRYRRGSLDDVPHSKKPIVDVLSLSLPSSRDKDTGIPYLDAFTMYRLGFVEAEDGTKMPQLYLRQYSEVSDGLLASDYNPLKIFYQPINLSGVSYETAQILAESLGTVQTRDGLA